MDDSSNMEESREASDATLWTLLLWSEWSVCLRGVWTRRESEQETESCWEERRDFDDLQEKQEEEQEEEKQEEDSETRDAVRKQVTPPRLLTWCSSSRLLLR